MKRGKKRGVSNLGRLMAKYNFAQGVDSDTDLERGFVVKKLVNDVWA